MEKYLSSHSNPKNNISQCILVVLLFAYWIQGTPLDNHPTHCLPHTPLHPPPSHIMADHCRSLCWCILERKNARPASISQSFARHSQMKMFMPITHYKYFEYLQQVLRHWRQPAHFLRYQTPRHTSAAPPWHTSGSIHTHPGYTDHSHNRLGLMDTASMVYL